MWDLSWRKIELTEINFVSYIGSIGFNQMVFPLQEDS